MNWQKQKLKVTMTKLFMLVGIFMFLVHSTHQLPVKEATSTEKDPNKHLSGKEGDSTTQNLENVIGECESSSQLSS